MRDLSVPCPVGQGAQRSGRRSSAFLQSEGQEPWHAVNDGTRAHVRTPGTGALHEGRDRSPTGGTSPRYRRRRQGRLPRRQVRQRRWPRPQDGRRGEVPREPPHLFPRHPPGRPPQLSGERPRVDPQPRPHRLRGRPVLADVRHRHPDPAVAHRAVHREVRDQLGDRVPLPPGRLPPRGDAVAAVADAARRLRDRRRRPPVRHEGLVHPGLRRLHAATWALPLPRFGDQRHRPALDHRAQGPGLLPVPALLGRPHPLRAPVALQGALLARHGGPHRPRHHRQARGTAQLPAVQAEPLRLPRRHAQPGLHRRPLRRRGRLPRLRDRVHLPAPGAGGPPRGHARRPVRRPRREHDRARRLVRPRRTVRLGHPRAAGHVGAGHRPGDRIVRLGHPGRRDAHHPGGTRDARGRGPRRAVAVPADAGRDHDPPGRGDAQRGHVAGRPRRAHPRVEVHQVPADHHLRTRRRRTLRPGRRPPRAAQRRRPAPRGGRRARRPAPPLGLGPARRPSRPDAVGARRRPPGRGPAERRHRRPQPAPQRRAHLLRTRVEPGAGGRRCCGSSRCRGSSRCCGSCRGAAGGRRGRRHDRGGTGRDVRIRPPRPRRAARSTASRAARSTAR